MNATEKLIDRDLTELLSGDTPPDLIAKTLAELETRARSSSRSERARSEALLREGSEGMQADQESAFEQPRPGRLIMFRRLASAACVALAVGLITWVLWPQPLPETVTASAGANYLVRDDHIQLNQGWLLLNDGAPQVRTGSGRVSVTGRAVVGPAIPSDDALDTLADQLGLSAEERVMFKKKERWLTAASLAICLFSGQAMFNGELIIAQSEDERVEVEDPKEGEGFRVLRKWEGNDSQIGATRCEVITDKEAWTNLWLEHTYFPQDETIDFSTFPKVDFATEQVVAVFGGRGFDSAGYRVRDILKARNGWVIRVGEDFVKRTQPHSPEVVHTYGIWVIPNDGGSILVEEDVRNELDEVPLWKSIGSRLGSDDLRDDTQDYLPTHTITRAGGPEVAPTEYQVIRSLNEWQAVLERVDDDSANWPDPDFSESIAIAAFGSALNGRGNFVLDVWGFTESSLHLRLIAPVAQAGPNPSYAPIYGVWVLKRHALDLVIETPKYGRIGEPARWQTTLTAKQGDEPFGVYYAITNSGGGLKEAKFGIANSSDEFNDLIEGMDVRWQSDPDWVDWEREAVVVIFPGEMRVHDGISFTTDVFTKGGMATSGAGDTKRLPDESGDVLTFHLTAPSGVDPGIKAQYAFVKVKKPSRTLVINQRLTAGPAPAKVKEVARFEK